MSLREEKIEQSLNELMLTVKDVNLDLSELQERASLNNSAVVDDYENYYQPNKKH